MVEGLVESQQKIITLVRSNPSISKREMAEQIGTSTTAIDKNIIILKEKGLLKRIGSDRGGHWQELSSTKPELVEGLVEGLVESQQKIITLVRSNPSISKREMAEQIGISTTAIDKNIIILKEKGLLKRIGSDRGGHWQELPPAKPVQE
ncbi:MAG: HTH domain-containing protein [Candidatus Electryonea clarkiae]|nr:HTH domain-containing protein [Candidatus Electryonea clarkiae]MDP8285216.1 HTH domain-containing protein [Candidatus Electryonea clarkiae]